MTAFVLYRCYDAGDTLVYVGISINPGKRFETHSRTSPWWSEITRIQLEHHPDLAALRAAEAAAVRDEHPRENSLLVDIDPDDEFVGKWLIAWRDGKAHVRGQILSRPSRNRWTFRAYYPSGKPAGRYTAQIEDIARWTLYDTREDMEAAL